MKKMLLTSLVILVVVSSAPLMAKPALEKAADWAGEKANWVKDKAHSAKDKIKKALSSEITTVKEFTVNLSKVVGGGTVILFGAYLAHANLYNQTDFRLRRTGLGLIGIAMALCATPFFFEGAKELVEKKINFSAIARDTKSYFKD